jgi:hypothetical protein
VPAPTEIREFLDFYCDNKARLDYAVLIDGPWGCGKTHFVKTYLADRDEKAKRIDALVGAPYLYVSLYGVNRAEQVRERLFAQAHPALSSKAAKIVTGGLLGVLNHFTGFKVEKEDQRLDEIFPRLESGVIVFDDLEIVSTPVVEALGWINEFVDSGEFKIIIVCNQSEIPNDQKNDFDKRREKVIGRMISLTADAEFVIKSFISEIKDDRARGIMETHFALMLSIFTESGTRNFRSLRVAISDYERIIASVDARLAKADNVARDLLAYVLAAGIEFRAGLPQEEFGRLLSSRLSLGYLMDSERSTFQKLREIQDKYPEVNWSQSVVPPDNVVALLTSGTLDVPTINRALSVCPGIADAPSWPSWRRLLHWPKRGQAAYAVDRADALDDFAHRRIIHPGEILHLTGTLLWLADYGDNLFENIESSMRAYIDDIESSKTLVPALAVFEDSPADAWAGIIFPYNENVVFKTVRDYLRAAVEQAFDMEMKTEAPALLAKLRDASDEERMKRLYEIREGETVYAGVPVLHNINVGEFADLLIVDGVPERDAVTALVRRYQYWGTNCALLKERDWLSALDATLRARMASLTAPHSSAVAKYMERFLSEAKAAMDQIAARCTTTDATP